MLRQIETRSLPTLTHCFPRSFTFYVAHPIHSIHRRNGREATAGLSGAQEGAQCPEEGNRMNVERGTSWHRAAPVIMIGLYAADFWMNLDMFLRQRDLHIVDL